MGACRGGMGSRANLQGGSPMCFVCWFRAQSQVDTINEMGVGWHAKLHFPVPPPTHTHTPHTHTRNTHTPTRLPVRPRGPE
jgi:hypothetical protein